MSTKLLKKKAVKKRKPRASKASTPQIPKWKLVIGSLAVVAIFLVYKAVFQSNTAIRSKVKYHLIDGVYSVHDLADSLESQGLINNSFFLRLMAEYRNLDRVKPGLYKFEKGLSNYQIVSLLKEESIKDYKLVEVSAYRLRRKTVDALAAYYPDMDDEELWSTFENKDVQDDLGFNEEGVFSILIPGRYPLPVNLKPNELLEAIHGEYEHFWNAERINKADELGLKPEEVVVLASIVYSETKLKEEMPRIAGVYLNRLDIDMKLQSDPTLVYANQKFGTKRVRFDDKKIDSKYNTYMYHGLPPGPIHTTPTFVVESVLNREEHDYIYFCAKDDFSGCHMFSKDFSDHKKYAEKYRKALNKAGIL